MSITPEGHLKIFTIYREPTDFPDPTYPYVVRAFAIVPGGAPPQPLNWVRLARSIEAARASIPPEADTCIPRDVIDEAHIVESWL